MSTRIVKFDKLPTLRALYTNGTLKAAASPRYPSVASYLDRVSLFQGDITELEVDAIVNAANRGLLGLYIFDYAIHRAAGSGLKNECSKFPLIRSGTRCETGDAKITGAHDLPSQRVIHAVGPVYDSTDVDTVARQLASCYGKSLQLTVDNLQKQVSFPSISTGIYGYPIEDATHIALNETRRFLDSENSSRLDLVVFTVFSNKDREVYE
ncbi:A1pp-domain-containing protein [Rickenella mellea]|uniref:A1pp-domain-containing protein n=1 Tax=Rickenella mellea TaxID=50990 RepID=A0A4Y7PZG0_9AGAM|nr:A1pp-domain-containing protein [Rickenella mellea]